MLQTYLLMTLVKHSQDWHTHTHTCPRTALTHTLTNRDTVHLAKVLHSVIKLWGLDLIVLLKIPKDNFPT